MNLFRRKEFTQQLATAKGTFKSTTTWGKTQTERMGNWLFPQREEIEEEDNRFLQGFLGIVLWVAFGAFLLASLPHIAYFFASLEPEDAKGNVSDYWWVIAYILAISIDVTSFLLSLNLANKMRRATRGLGLLQRMGVGLRIAVMHWPFIILLVGFSWLVNFEHATQFHSTMLDLAENVQLNLWFWQGNLYTLNPIVGSAFPVLAFAYTCMSEDVRRTRTSRTSNTPSNTQLTTTQTEQTDTQKMLEVILTLAEQNRVNNEQSRANLEQMMSVTIEAVSEVKKVVRALPTGEQQVPMQRKHMARTPNIASVPTTEKLHIVTTPNTQTEQDIEEKVYLLVMNDPNVKTREIARTLTISPSTAHKWRTKAEVRLHANGLTGRTVESEE